MFQRGTTTHHSLDINCLFLYLSSVSPVSLLWRGTKSKSEQSKKCMLVYIMCGSFLLNPSRLTIPIITTTACIKFKRRVQPAAYVLEEMFLPTFLQSIALGKVNVLGLHEPCLDVFRCTHYHVIEHTKETVRGGVNVSKEPGN